MNVSKLTHTHACMQACTHARTHAHTHTQHFYQRYGMKHQGTYPYRAKTHDMPQNELVTFHVSWYGMFCDILSHTVLSGSQERRAILVIRHTRSCVTHSTCVSSTVYTVTYTTHYVVSYSHPVIHQHFLLQADTICWRCRIHLVFNGGSNLSAI